MDLAALRSGGKRAIARALSRLDRPTLTPDDAALLDTAFAAPQGLVLGLTGPPGVGKSTLTQALIDRLRGQDHSVAVIAVDPSSRSSGGALLGDRTRLSLDPDDAKLFVRSLAARDRLGGLSDHALAAVILVRSLFDIVLVETVGTGQSDADITLVADRTLVCLQPGSGDALQFMKAGIMEWPDAICVTKADMGAMAKRAIADVEGALGLATFQGRGPSVHLVSAKTGDGVNELVATLTQTANLQRGDQAAPLVRDALLQRFGTHGVALCDVDAALNSAQGPFRAILALSQTLSRHG